MSEIDQLLQIAEEAVTAADAEVEAATVRARKARDDRDVLRRLVTRLRGTTPPPTDQSLKEWVVMTRPDAIIRLLKERGSAMSPREICQALNDLGRAQDTPALTSGAIVKLKNRGLVSSPRHGYWAIAEIAETLDLVAAMEKSLDKARRSA